MDDPGKRKIVINGKTYDDPEDMPPEIRDVYERAMSMLEDGDANGVPDLLEGKGPGVWQTAKQVWSLGRDAHRAGIRSVDMPGLGARRAGTAPQAPRSGATPGTASPRAPDGWTTETRTVTSSSSSFPPGPQEVGGSNLRKLVLAIVVATAFAFALQQLGWIE